MMTDEIEIVDEVSETAKAAQNVDKALGSPMALLLGPTFKLIGEHWGKKTDAYLNPKQIKNLEEKIAIAQEHGPLLLGNDTKPRQIAALVEWTDAAHNVNGDKHPNLSKAWAKALRDISEQSYILLDSLSKLDEDDIKILKEGGMLSKEQLEKFTRIGIINAANIAPLAWYVLHVSLGMIFLIASAAIGLATLAATVSKIFGWPEIPVLSDTGWVLVMLFLVLVLFTFRITTGVAIDLWREFIKKENIANISAIGREIISKLEAGEKTVLSYYKRDLAKERQRSNHWL